MNVPISEENRLVISEEIVSLEEELELLRMKEAKSRQKVGRFASVANRTLLYVLFGPRLTKGLAALLHSAREKTEPLLGAKLANVLDAASRRMTGYKRWAITFGLIAALPGIISLILIWQQNTVVARETQNTLADIENRLRLDLLLTIYSSEEKSPNDALITPSYSSSLRAESALKLIAMDSASYREAERVKGEPFLWRVDLSQAPLGRVNFSPMKSEPQREISRVSFVASNFFNSSFHRCKLSECWFDQSLMIKTDFSDAVLDEVVFTGAALFSVNFKGAEFKNCDFKGAKFNAETQWPDGFDPLAAGAVPMNSNPGGGS
ncbi:hypothetical protein NT6N_15780 [Oceaniferula spumae]|uniref:Pentapeptide repeat-containing protein n=1 Tax=Oceaniferula spumae TaxID=2979115 RepID=A0AAT9FKR7_9BACT